MAANTITRDQLRRLADVRPERGRVLSVFLNLDPAEFATPGGAIDGDHVGPHRGRAPRRGGRRARPRRARGAQGRRRARARGAPGRTTSRRTARAPSPCTPAARPTCSRSSGCAARSTPPSCSTARRTSSRWSPTPDAERWCVLLANRRNARFFVGDGGGLEETDRVEDDVHSQHDQGGWSQSRYQRGVEKEKDDHLVHVADVAFAAYKQRGFDRLLIGAPDELVGELEAQAAPVPARADRRPAAPRRRELRHRGRPRGGREGDRGLDAALRARGARPAGRGRRPRRPRRRRARRRARGAQRAARRDRCWSRTGFRAAGRPRPRDRHALRRRPRAAGPGARALRERRRARRSRRRSSSRRR